MYVARGGCTTAAAVYPRICYDVTVLGTVDQNGPEQDQRGVLQVLASLIRHDHLCHKGKNGV